MSGYALVLDDSRSMRVIASKVLQALDFEVLEAENGEAALAVLDEHPDCRVGLIDWRMEGMDGFEFIQKVRADDRFAAMKLIMVTVENARSKVMQAAEVGIDSYLLKPYDKDVLTKRLRELDLVDDI